MGDSCQTYRVRVCRGCCGERSHIELGSYIDIESAMLVNDCHELLAGRNHKLLVLVRGDERYAHMLVATRCARNSRSLEQKAVMQVLEEKEHEQKQRVVSRNALPSRKRKLPSKGAQCSQGCCLGTDHTQPQTMSKSPHALAQSLSLCLISPYKDPILCFAVHETL
jgi:hypothetical protein